jgi:hypothetical protein
MKKVLFLVVLLLTTCGTSFGDATVGMYYYTGWSPVTGVVKPDPWRPIKPYSPVREPLLGWYDEREVNIVNQQLNWMADYGVDFVVFCWYWTERISRVPPIESAEAAYLNAPARSRIPYALLWANHFPEPTSSAEWDKIVQSWLDRHLKNPEYLRIDEKPVLFVFSPDHFRDQASKIGSNNSANHATDAKALLDRARARAVDAGLKGIYFVLCVPAAQYWTNFAANAGFDALSAYNYHFGIEGGNVPSTPDSESFAELDTYFRMQWNWILRNSSIPYFVPMTAGWDRRPWGGSSNPNHDNCAPTPQEFETHLRAGYDTIVRYSAKTKGIGMLCCWNEFGEGSIIEPTKRYQFEFLKRVQKVFAR